MQKLFGGVAIGRWILHPLTPVDATTCSFCHSLIRYIKVQYRCNRETLIARKMMFVSITCGLSPRFVLLLYIPVSGGTPIELDPSPFSRGAVVCGVERRPYGDRNDKARWRGIGEINQGLPPGEGGVPSFLQVQVHDHHHHQSDQQGTFMRYLELYIMHIHI